MPRNYSADRCDKFQATEYVFVERVHAIDALSTVALPSFQSIAIRQSKPCSSLADASGLGPNLVIAWAVAFTPSLWTANLTGLCCITYRVPRQELYFELRSLMSDHKTLSD